MLAGIEKGEAMINIWSVTKLQDEYDPDVSYYPTKQSAEFHAMRRFGRFNTPNIYVDCTLVTEEEFVDLLDKFGPRYWRDTAREEGIEESILSH